MIGLSAQVTGLSEVSRALKGVRGGLDKRKNALRKIKKRQTQKWRRHFDSRGGLYGPGWPQGNKYDSESGRLRRSGEMRAYVFRMNDEAEVDDEQIRWEFRNRPGNSRPGKWVSPVSHQVGYPLGSSRIPARPIWEIDDDDEERAEQLLGEHVDAVIERYFGQ